MQVFKDLYEYRELLKTNVKKDIRGKYKGSFLGILWSFLNPLLQVIVYAIVFPYLMRGATIENYVVYLVTGIIPWSFFSTVVGVGTTVIKSNQGIIKKVYFPREILIISQVISGLVNFFISCVIILLFCLGFGVGVSIHILFIPVIAIIQAILSLGILFITSSINVYIQDLEYIVSFLLNMAFYGTPIIYEISQFASAGTLLKFIELNPMTPIINAYRDVFLYHQWPNPSGLIYVAILGLIILVVGYLIFRKLEKGFAEQL
ncbi:ABC transporter permease [Faecalitalea cylindroides]|uniref:ABC transporter permease n=1 Tax=Faecalitalea cylindroides TaxID=39483 RepID=UPI00195F1158|nr:ABC transporter permease [Faecalitalea cylindroides]MBM6653596.1 ABC transporter permease [Faecalitalea cylindroides]MBM6809994.1 ABC transporter permease [Faecalitalea cylindroides]